jgi:hypothetical protein
MNFLADWLVRWYAKLLRLYPPHFRADFAEEMSSVFALRVREFGGNRPRLLLLALRELAALPQALLAAHVRERSKITMQKRLDRWFIHAPGSWPEVLLACLPFLLLFLFSGMFSFARVEAGVPAPVGLALLGLVVLFLAVLGVIGLLARLPRWAMPYAGVLLSLGAYLVLLLSGIFTYFFSAQMSTSWWLRLALFEFIYLCVLAASLILVIWLAPRLSLTGSFFERVQKDSGILSFAMYGGGMTFILGMYEDISGAGLYILSTAIPLLLGIWVYLHLRAKQAQIIVLSIALTLAIGIALVANLRLMDWESPLVFSLGGLGIDRSIVSIFLTWLLCQAMLFMPLLLRKIPFSRHTPAPAG